MVSIFRIRPTFVCLTILYLVWGTSYLANRYALQSFPPLALSGSRFALAGTLMLIWAYGRGGRLSSWRSGASAGLIGVLLLTCGSAGVTFAQQWVSTSVAAISVASVGLWTAVFAGLFGTRSGRSEWLGIALGLLGVVLLNGDRELTAAPQGAVLLVLSSICWGFGSALSRRLPMPEGTLSAGYQLFCGGWVLLGLSQWRGERLLHSPSLISWVALVYLAIFASLLAFSAYTYLIAHERPAVATSYAYVNPLVAVALGWGVADERISLEALVGLAVILAALLLVTRPVRSS